MTVLRNGERRVLLDDLDVLLVSDSFPTNPFGCFSESKLESVSDEDDGVCERKGNERKRGEGGDGGRGWFGLARSLLRRPPSPLLFPLREEVRFHPREEDVCKNWETGMDLQRPARLFRSEY